MDDPTGIGAAPSRYQIQDARCGMPPKPTFRPVSVVQIEGVDVPNLASAEGGEASGEVVVEAPVRQRVGKHIGGVRYAPIVLDVGWPLADPLSEWVMAMLDGTQTPRSGAIITVDEQRQERSRLEWRSAVITEITFPAANVSAKDAARIRVVLQPETTIFVRSGGVHTLAPQAGSPKPTLRSHFRFEIAGLAGSDRTVSEVSSIVVRRQGTITAGSAALDTGGALYVSNVTVRVPESAAAPYTAWFDDFVIKGSSGAAQEKSATLAFLDPSLTNVIQRVDLAGVGIFRVSRHNQGAFPDDPAMVTIEMYCEAIRLS